MHLIVLRHGRTAFNAEGRYQGSIDTDLDATGLAQAAQLHAALPPQIDAIVSSPMRRALRTAEAVAGARGLPISLAAEFRERGAGVFEGLTAPEARERHPALWQRSITRQWGEGPPGGESIRDVFVRVASGLVRLHDALAGRTVLLVAHGFVSKAIRAAVLGRTDDFFAWQLRNCECLPLTVDPHQLRSLEDLGQDWPVGAARALDHA